MSLPLGTDIRIMRSGSLQDLLELVDFAGRNRGTAVVELISSAYRNALHYACWCRLTQPEKRRRKKASGGGSGSMAEACPRGRPGSRAASLGYRRPADRAEVPEAQASSKASTRLFFGDPSSPEFSHLTALVADNLQFSGTVNRAPLLSRSAWPWHS